MERPKPPISSELIRVGVDSSDILVDGIFSVHLERDERDPNAICIHGNDGVLTVRRYHQQTIESVPKLTEKSELNSKTQRMICVLGALDYLRITMGDDPHRSFVDIRRDKNREYVARVMTPQFDLT